MFFAGFAPGVQVGGRRLDQSGAKIPVVAGCVIAAVGLALWGSSVTHLSLNNQWYYIIIAGFGLGLMLGPSNTDAINQVGRLSYGEATGVTQTTRNFGASFGLAFLGTLLVSVERNHLVTRLTGLGLSSGTAHSVAKTIAQNRESTPRSAVHGAFATHVYHAAQLSLADGIQDVLYAMAAVMVVAAIVARIGLRPGIHVAADSIGEAAPSDSVTTGEPARGRIAGYATGSTAGNAGAGEPGSYGGGPAGEGGLAGDSETGEGRREF